MTFFKHFCDSPRAVTLSNHSTYFIAKSCDPVPLNVGQTSCCAASPSVLLSEPDLYRHVCSIIKAAQHTLLIKPTLKEFTPPLIIYISSAPYQ